MDVDNGEGYSTEPRNHMCGDSDGRGKAISSVDGTKGRPKMGDGMHQSAREIQRRALITEVATWFMHETSLDKR